MLIRRHFILTAAAILIGIARPLDLEAESVGVRGDRMEAKITNAIEFNGQHGWSYCWAEVRLSPSAV